MEASTHQAKTTYNFMLTQQNQEYDNFNTKFHKNMQALRKVCQEMA